MSGHTTFLKKVFNEKEIFRRDVEKLQTRILELEQMVVEARAICNESIYDVIDLDNFNEWLENTKDVGVQSEQ